MNHQALQHVARALDHAAKMAQNPAGLMWTLHRQEVTKSVTAAWDLLLADLRFSSRVNDSHKVPFSEMARGEPETGIRSDMVVRLVVECAHRVASKSATTTAFSFADLACVLRDVKKG